MAEIALTQGYITVVDDAGLEWLSQHRWKVLKSKGNVYAARTAHRTQTILMHRIIVGALIEENIDHINGNGLDNRRSNLRVATQTQNLANMRKTRGKSIFKGVYWPLVACCVAISLCARRNFIWSAVRAILSLQEVKSCYKYCPNNKRAKKAKITVNIHCDGSEATIPRSACPASFIKRIAPSDFILVVLPPSKYSTEVSPANDCPY